MASVPARRVARTRAWWACLFAVLFMAGAVILFAFDANPGTVIERWELWGLVSIGLFEASFIIQT